MNKSTKGWLLVALGCILFIMYWVILLVPVQAKWAGSGEYPSIVSCLIAAALVGLTFGSLTYVGNALTKDKAHGVRHTDFSFGQLFGSKAFWWWSAISVAVTILFTVLWRNDL